MTKACRILGLIVMFAAAGAAQNEGKKIALIIGNNNYSVSPLKNAVNDARLMDKALQSAGFSTIVRLDAGKAAMEEAVAEFVGRLGPDDTALFFYAGHGVQIESENFLVPVDFEAANSVIQAKVRCFGMSQFFDYLKNRSKRSIVVLDACRSNPIAEKNSLAGGLAQPQNAGKETYVAFSTSPGQTAADNPDGRDSWFTEALADLLNEPGLPLDEVFTRVKRRVSTETNGRQAPWTTSSLSSTFYFHPPDNLAMENDPSLAEKWMLEAQRREKQQQWAEAIALLHQVLNRKPGGLLESSAATKLQYLTAREEAAKKFDANDFQAAAGSFEQALKVDPFSTDSALAAADSYLLEEHLPEAVRLLNTVRARGSGAAVAKANAMLQELAAVYPDAGVVLKSGIPAPPPIQDLFADIPFESPDWSTGIRFVESTPMQLTRWVKALETAYPPPPAPSEQPAQVSALQRPANDPFHIEVIPTGESRDLSIRRISEQVKDGPTGVLILNGSEPQTLVLLNGSPVAQQLPASIVLPPGKYKVVGVRQGENLNSQEVELAVSERKTVMVEGR